MKGRKWLLSAMTLLALGLTAVPLGRWLDLQLSGEPLRNTWAAVRWNEDWSRAAPLPAGLNQDWLAARDSSGIIRIAHALGGASTIQQNTLVALRAAQAERFLLFELDLWLDQDGNLRCFHEAEAGQGPPPMTPGDCTLSTVLDEMAGQPGWLVLDLKTDFAVTGRAVTRLLRDRDDAAKVVFQLYRPEHLGHFSAWAAALPLPSPIVTAYAAHRGVQHIGDQLPRLGVRAMALPLRRRATLVRPPVETLLLLHPIHDCAALAIARDWGAAGGYMASRLQCARSPP